MTDPRQRVEERKKTWKRTTTMQRFCKKIEVRRGECWPWLGGRGRTGYGRFWNGEASVASHRFMFQLFNEVALSTQNHICHSCDNPSCVNPDHLFLGDALANQRDSVAKGRHITVDRACCPKGHQYTGKRNSRNERVCTVCALEYYKRRDWSAEYKRRKARELVRLGGE